MDDPYEPASYWEERLGREFTLKGTGHQQYGEAYNRWLYRNKARLLRRLLPARLDGVRALDVGSGTGWVVEQLLARGATVDGCDITDVSVERLSARFPDVSFAKVALGADPLPAADATYDLVTLLDVAYHVVDDAAWASAVAELARVLRPGGRLVLTDGLGPAVRSPAPHVRFRPLSAWASAPGLAVDRVVPYCRWLSRDPSDAPLLGRVDERVRGALEYALERSVPRSPHLRGAVLVRTGGGTPDGESRVGT